MQKRGVGYWSRAWIYGGDDRLASKDKVRLRVRDRAGLAIADDVERRQSKPCADRKCRATTTYVNSSDGECCMRSYRVHVKVAVKVAPREALAIRTPAPACACSPKETSTW